MHGWRAKIGEISPELHGSSRDWSLLLPDGVDLLVVTLGTRRMTTDEFDRVWELYLGAAKRLAEAKVEFITMGGSPILTHKGIDKIRELIAQVEEATGLKCTTDVTAPMEAFDRLSAKNIVLATPYADERNEERKRLVELCGYKVLAMKGLGIMDVVGQRSLPSYAPYQVVKQLFRESPEANEADAIWVSCGAWEVVGNIELIERDFGKPVVTCIQSRVWAALSALHIREPIIGYGKLLREML